MKRLDATTRDTSHIIDNKSSRDYADDTCVCVCVCVRVACPTSCLSCKHSDTAGAVCDLGKCYDQTFQDTTQDTKPCLSE